MQRVASLSTQERKAEPQASKSAKPPSLRRNFSWTLIGNVAYAAAQWANLVLLAKIGSPAMVGEFSLGLAVATPIMIFSNLKLRAVQATDAKGEYRFSHYFWFRMASTALAMAAIVVVGGIAYGDRPLLVISLVGLAKSFESISDVCFGLLQQRERMELVAYSLILKGVLAFAAMAGGVWFGGTIVWGVAAMAASWGILVLLDLRNVAVVLGNRFLQELRPSADCAMLWRLAKLALPLGVVTSLGSLRSNIPRYFVENSMGAAELGIFSALMYVLVADNTVLAALAQAVSPRLARYYAQGELTAFRRMVWGLLICGALVGVAGLGVSLIIGERIIAVLYGSEYAAHIDTFLWLMVACMITNVYVFLGTAASAARAFKVQLPIQIASVVVILVASLALVPAYGLVGAAWTLCIGAACEGLFYLAATGKYVVGTRSVSKSAFGEK